MRLARAVCLALLAAFAAGCATGVEDEQPTGLPATGGSGGTGTAGSGGTGGSATGGQGGTAGTAGTAGNGGSAGADVDAEPPDGSAGSAGQPDAADDQGTVPDAADAGPDAIDAGQDVSQDAAQDVGADTAVEAGEDVSADVSPDVLADVAADVVDGGLDAAPEAGLDAADEAEAGVIANEACPGEALTLAGTGTTPRTASVQGTTQGLKNDTSGSCAGSGYADAVYSFTPDVSGIATVTVATTSFDAALYIRTACSTSSSQLVCTDVAYSSGTETATIWVTAGQTYYVFVDGATSTKGPFTLGVSVVPETPDEQCPGEAVVWSGSGTQNRTASVSGNTSARWDNYDGSCGSSSTPEAVYAFTADVDGQMKLVLSSPGWDGVLYVRSTCATASSETACKDVAGSSGTESAQFWATAGTTYYAFVDGSLSSSKGAYTLTGTLSPEQPVETCPGEPVVWTGSGTDTRTFTANGDTSLRWSDTAGSCGASGANDAVYAVTPDVDGILTVEVTPSGWDTAMYIRTACTSSASEVVCRDTVGSGSKESYTLWAMAGTTYYVFVDGYTNTSKGPYTFQATLVPQVPAEKCDGETLSWSGSPPSITVNGNTSSMWSDLTGSCGGSASKDAVYHVVAPQSGTMTVKLTPSTWDAVLYVRSGTCTGTEAGCRDQASAGSAETVTVSATAGTDYYLIVDGYSGGSGSYTLTAHF